MKNNYQIRRLGVVMNESKVMDPTRDVIGDTITDYWADDH